jgi:hypothetical protein
MNMRTKGALPLFTIIGALVIVSAESAIAAGQDLLTYCIDQQCRNQYGSRTVASLQNVNDAKSWKCFLVGNPKLINMSHACLVHDP